MRIQLATFLTGAIATIPGTFDLPLEKLSFQGKDKTYVKGSYRGYKLFSQNMPPCRAPHVQKNSFSTLTESD